MMGYPYSYPNYGFNPMPTYNPQNFATPAPQTAEKKGGKEEK